MQPSPPTVTAPPPPDSSTVTTTSSYNIPLPFLHFPNIDFSKSLSFPSFSSKAEELFSQYFTAVMIGAGLGAAVSAGVVGGLVASSSLMRYFRSPTSLWNYWSDGSSLSPARRQAEHNEESSDASKDDANSTRGNVDSLTLTATTISTMNADSRGQLFVLKGQVGNDEFHNSEQLQPHVDTDATTRTSKPTEQCRECIRNLERLMEQCHIGWDCVRKMTVYLVVDSCKASEFYKVMEDVPNFPKERIVTTLLFVHMLENNSVVQVELLATTRRS